MQTKTLTENTSQSGRILMLVDGLTLFYAGFLKSGLGCRRNNKSSTIRISTNL